MHTNQVDKISVCLGQVMLWYKLRNYYKNKYTETKADVRYSPMYALSKL